MSRLDFEEIARSLREQAAKAFEPKSPGDQLADAIRAVEAHPEIDKVTDAYYEDDSIVMDVRIR